MSSEREAQMVAAAQAGNQEAQDRLVAEYLPLVYNITGRALNGHADVDDVVQDTMIRVLGSLHTLRSPDSFRSWLVAITMNQIRGHWRERRTEAIPGGGVLGDGYDVVDPGADFVDLTILRLGLSGQRQETAEATRWLDEDDRALLSLWWLEAAGELSRAEVADAMELTPQHTAVRVQRMKAQLEAARVVVRALDAQPRCVLLEPIVASWDGIPSALWRKRIARHARDCTSCAGHWSNLVPAEGLLVGLALVPVAAALSGKVAAPGFATAASAHTAHATHAADTIAAPHLVSTASAHAAPSRAAGRRGDHSGADSASPSARTQARLERASRRRRTTVVAAGVAVLVAGGAAVSMLNSPDPKVAEPATAAAPADKPLPSASASQSPSPTPSVSASPSPKPSPSKSSAKPSPKPSPVKPKSQPKPETKAPEPEPATGGSTAEQVIALVNAERSKAGCGPVSNNGRLAAAATNHSDDMAARGFFDHTNPDGEDPGDRITDAGYRWSTYGENIARGQQSPESVMESWMNSSGHRANILNCSFKELGVGIHNGSGGPWWTQAFGSQL
ncbi:sigma-70 family RNA polymerase sigma factor [Streptomyces sp. NPDC127084]|uniref:sigma-70 family RNA polymerase sigma factor n=1 Tax=Streptomyces sp. NPDC127084 TaxID=3347133 RepID=UPI00365DC429